jgi:phosphoglycerate dehydrogenase-like enzyme
MNILPNSGQPSEGVEPPVRSPSLGLSILFTTENGSTKETYFPQPVLGDLERVGQVAYNPNQGQPFTEEQLREAIVDMDVCLTHWGCPQFNERVLERANRLRLIAHAAGSVADLVTPNVFQRGIQVCSANQVMAKYTAESALAYILAGLKWLPQQAEDVKVRRLWGSQRTLRSLHNTRIGLVGLGTIGRFLLDLLAPFQAQVKVYDPYLAQADLAPYSQAVLAPLEEVLAWGEVISIHASLTPETRGLLDATKLRLLQDGCLLVNTARGPIIDETALIHELQSGRISAVLDVYTTEPLPLESELRKLENVTLFPHSAGQTNRGVEMSRAVLEEIERFRKGESLQLEISFEKFNLMTRERQFHIYH